MIHDAVFSQPPLNWLKPKGGLGRPHTAAQPKFSFTLHNFVCLASTLDNSILGQYLSQHDNGAGIEGQERSIFEAMLHKQATYEG